MTIFLSFPFLLLWAVCLDALLGDPRYSYHPVRIIGYLCTISETFYRKRMPNHLVGAGVCTFLTVLLLTGGVIFLLLLLFAKLHPLLCLAASIFFLYSFVAMRDLLRHSHNIYRALLVPEDLAPARKALSWIVGRDTATLPREKIITACVESVVENMVDGITAPLFWAVCFSVFSLWFPLPAIAWAALGIALYKTANTMDSMFGYKNEKYFDFGKIPARFDDILTFLPARLSGLCLIIAAGLLGLNMKNSAKIFFRDRRKHASPNSGHSEAAAAGALNIQLGGPSYYFGSLVEKPTLGDALRIPEACDILRANRLVIVSSMLFFLLALLIRALILYGRA